MGISSPNFLIIMSDEHAPQFSSVYGHRIVRTPQMARLAAEGVTFDAAYCNSPLCVPSRLSFMTGKYVSQIGGWDNAKPLPIDTLTWPYLLREHGYTTALSGKMHLIGPDQLHGFEMQLARDIHAEDIHPLWPWRDQITPASEPWHHVLEAGAGTTKEILADDAAEAAALDYLCDPQRKQQPFALCVGFIAPHFPFIVPDVYYSQYSESEIDLPELPDGHLDSLPAFPAQMRIEYGFDRYTEEQVRRARAAYYGLITYLDDKLGRLLDALEECSLADDTVVIHTSDHGELLGEHGLWRKMSFYEHSSRIPLQIRLPEQSGSGERIDLPVSLVDVTATILDLAGVDENRRTELELPGHPLTESIHGTGSTERSVVCEYTAHGANTPRGMIRHGPWKLCIAHGRPDERELYNLDSDPGEFTNLAGEEKYQKTIQGLESILMDVWSDPDSLDKSIRADQEARRIIREVQSESSLF